MSCAMPMTSCYTLELFMQVRARTGLPLAMDNTGSVETGPNCVDGLKITVLATAEATCQAHLSLSLTRLARMEGLRGYP